MKGLNIARLVLYSLVLVFALVTAVMAGVVVANTNTECKPVCISESYIGAGC